MMTIGEACELAGFSTSALRFYESVELAAADWTDPATGYRYYWPERLYFLNFLKAYRDAGVPLAALRELGAHPAMPGLETVIERQLAALQKQILELRARRDWLRESRRKLGQRAAPVGEACLESLPKRWVCQLPHELDYGYQGYARARAWLKHNARHLGLKVEDTIIRRMAASEPFGLPALGWSAVLCLSTDGDLE
jgi:DNA-binding transcriptional MerR regulator